MTPAQHAVETLRLVRASIEQSHARPDPLEQRIKVLEARVIELCELFEDGILYISGEDAPKFCAKFRELGECCGFDADAYRESGYDRKDV